MSIGHDGPPRIVNYDGDHVPPDTDETLVEPDLHVQGDLVPEPRTSPDYTIPGDTAEKGEAKPKRRTILIAAGSAAVALAVAGGLVGILRNGGDDAPKDSGSRFDTSNSAEPSKTLNSQPPITAETTSVTLETKPSVPEVAVPLGLEGYVFLGDEAVLETESKGRLAITGNSATEASASVRQLAGQLMSGGTHPNQMMHTAGNNPDASKNHLAAQINKGLLSGVMEGEVTVDAKNPLLTNSVSLAEMIVGEHNVNIDANKQGPNIYTGGNISEVDLAGAEEVVMQGGYAIVKAKWAVNDYDRSGQEATKGALADTDSYVVSMHLRPGEKPGTWTIAKFAAVKAPNN